MLNYQTDDQSYHNYQNNKTQDDSRLQSANEFKLDLMKGNKSRKQTISNQRDQWRDQMRPSSKLKNVNSIELIQYLDEGLQLKEFDSIDKIIDKMMIHICGALAFYQ